MDAHFVLSSLFPLAIVALLFHLLTYQKLVVFVARFVAVVAHFAAVVARSASQPKIFSLNGSAALCSFLCFCLENPNKFWP